jgi:hypothetical protein
MLVCHHLNICCLQTVAEVAGEEDKLWDMELEEMLSEVRIYLTCLNSAALNLAPPNSALHA